jgi:hypothetical protein
MSSLFTIVVGSARDVWERLWNGAPIAGLLPILRPVPPYDGPALGPVSALAVFLGLVVTSGVAVGAAAVLVLALLGFHFLVSEVLGITIEVKAV